MFESVLNVGGVLARNGIALAPMAGVADVPFRQLAWELGAGYLVSEMVSSLDHLWDTKKNRLRRVSLKGVYPNVIQIAGSDPIELSETAKKVVDEGADIVDINFGCPAKKVCKKFVGSALLDDIPRIGRIVEAVVGSVSVPVTIKTRIGSTPSDLMGIEASYIAQEAGAQLVVMHSRSRACRFKGPVDHEKTAKLKSRLKIPFFVNGDISSRHSASLALQESGADGVMVGRGAVGQPWIFRELLGEEELSLPEKWRIVRRHLSLSYDFYGKTAGLKMMKKHIKAYLIKLGCEDLSARAMKLEDPDVMRRLLSVDQMQQEFRTEQFRKSD